MSKHTRMLLMATAAAVSMPALANAATVVSTNNIFADESYSFAGVILPGEIIEFRFFVMEDLQIDDFSLSGTGTDAEEDLLAITFGRFNPPTQGFSEIQNIGSVSAGLGFLDGETFQSGDAFSIFVEDGIDNDVAVTVSFEADSISPIPLPASGLLMLPFLLGGAYAGWRRRKSQSATA